MVENSLIMRELRFVAAIRKNTGLLDQFEDKLTSRHFSQPEARMLFDIIQHNYKELNGVIISKEEMQSQLLDKLGRGNHPLTDYEAFNECVNMVFEMETTDVTERELGTFIISNELGTLADILHKWQDKDGPEALTTYRERLQNLEVLATRDTDLGIFPFSEEVLSDPRKLIDECYGGVPVPTGIAPLDQKMLGGFRVGELGVIVAGTGVGKAQPLDSLVLTPSGWVTMGSIRVGDTIVSSNGGPQKVTGVFPQGTKQVFRVDFSGGESVECCEDHLWAVRTKKDKNRGKPFKVMALKDLGNLVSNGSYKWQTPIISKPIEFNPIAVPLDPYTIGLLLGDGTLKNSPPRYTTADVELVTHLRSTVPYGVLVTKDKGSAYDYRLSTPNKGRTKGPNALSKILNDLGMRHGSREKFVPELYLYNSSHVRLSVLQGLFDTDGYAAPNGGVEYCTASTKLYENVLFLVRSLGGRVHSDRIKRVGDKEYHRVFFTFSKGIVPFRLKRKVDSYKEPTKYFPVRHITKISPVRYAECQCISVDSQDSLYVTNDLVLTHNTAVMLNMALNAMYSGSRVLYYALDNTSGEILERIFANRSQVDIDVKLEPDAWREKILQNSGKVSHKNFCVKHYPPDTITVRDIQRHIRKLRMMWHAEDLAAGLPLEQCGQGPHLVVVDYGDLMLPTKSRDEYRLELKNIFDGLTRIAQEEGLVVLTASQGNRETLSKEIVTLQQISESFSKAFVASVVITVCQTDKERAAGEFRLAAVKMRRPESNYMVHCKVNYKTMTITPTGDITHILGSRLSDCVKDGSPNAENSAKKMEAWRYSIDRPSFGERTSELDTAVTPNIKINFELGTFPTVPPPQNDIYG